MNANDARARVLDIARGELDVREDDGSNRDKAGRIAGYWAHVNDSRWSVDIGYRPGADRRNEWCMAWASAVYARAGVPLEHPHGSGFYGCGRCILWLVERGFWRSEREADPKPGDLIFIAWDKFSLKLDEREADITPKEAHDHVRHVGIVEAYDPMTGIVDTIEGNLSAGVNRGQRSFEDGLILGFGSILGDA